MKKILCCLLLLCGIGSLSAQVQFENKTTDELRAMAVKSGKLVFIDLYASWCPPCRMMDKMVFSTKEVGDFISQRFVSAKYDTDKQVGKELMQKYGKGSIPTYLIFNTNGELLGRLMGASSAKEFMRDITTILSKQHSKTGK